jgi:hypothetical protein
VPPAPLVDFSGRRHPRAVAPVMVLQAAFDLQAAAAKAAPAVVDW